jgi:hypothetical protein
MWVRRVFSAPLLLLTLICLIGTVRILAGNLPGSSAGEGVVVMLFAAAAGAGAYFLLRPDLRRLRELGRRDTDVVFYQPARPGRIPLRRCRPGDGGRSEDLRAFGIPCPVSLFGHLRLERCDSSPVVGSCAARAPRFHSAHGSPRRDRRGAYAQGVWGSRDALPPSDGRLPDPAGRLRHRALDARVKSVGAVAAQSDGVSGHFLLTAFPVRGPRCGTVLHLSPPGGLLRGPARAGAHPLD